MNRGRALWRWGLRLVTLLTAGWLALVVAVLWWATKDDALRRDDRIADAIVVLGAAQYGGRPSPVLKARLDHAIMLWEDGLAPYLLLTGGKAEGDRATEAEAGRAYAIAAGVEPAAILVETAGRTSFASMREAARLVRGVEGGTVLLVSDPFHVLRLSLTARLLGLEARVSPTRTSPISRSPRVVAEYVLRETVAVPADVVRAVLAGDG